jgi:hypothetical protein
LKIRKINQLKRNVLYTSISWATEGMNTSPWELIELPKNVKLAMSCHCNIPWLLHVGIPWHMLISTNQKGNSIWLYKHLKLIYCCCFDFSVFQWEALSKRLWKLARWPNSKVWAEMEYKLHYSMDWFIAKVTGNHVFSYSKWKFPLRFSLQHSINSEGNSAESIRIYFHVL